jgi:serine/threonine-protein kinase
MLNDDGRAKILDFGLARADLVNESDDASATPTITSPAPLTQAGTIVGTAAYMSPEQATGRPVDRRSDIWSFGCVLYELLTGTRAFAQDDVPLVLEAVLTKDPDWTALERCPPSVQRLVRRCLAKDRRRRFADMSDVRLDLEDSLSGEFVPLTAPIPSAVRSNPIPWIVAAVSAVSVLALVAASPPWRRAVPQPQVMLDVSLGAPVSLVIAQGPGAILSPDGTVLAFVGQPRTTGSMPQIYVRRLDSLTAAPLVGTEGAMSPFFSPDGQWVGFFAGSKVKKAALSGGGAIELADAPNGRGGSWGDDHHIVFMPDFYSGLWRVPASGGTAVRVTTPADNSGTHRWPQVLPGSKAVIYTSHSILTGYEEASIILQPLPAGEPVVLQQGGYFGRYLASGHLVYMHEGSMYAAPFDLKTMRRTRDAVPVLDDVANGAFWTGAAQFSASENGRLVHLSGTDLATPIAWQHQDGAPSSLRAAASSWSDPAFESTGDRMALTVFDGRRSDVWLFDAASDAMTRLTRQDYSAFKPVWTPDGSRVAFTAARGDRGVFIVAWQRADGSGEVQALSQGENGRTAVSFHPNGRFLAINELDPTTSFDIKIVEIRGNEAEGWSPEPPQLFLKTAAVELEPMFSPDGRWIAYASNESGRFEIYVRPFPGPGGVWQVSRAGGTFPTWSRARPELIFSTLDQRLMSSSYVADGQSFRAAPPRAWSPTRHQLLGPVITRNFDVHPDGKRAAISLAPDENAAGARIVMIMDFFSELARRVAP